MTWSGKRKLFINGLLIVFIILPIFYYGYNKFKPVPDCFNRKKDGIETGIDCGGKCVLYCPYERKDIVVVFARAQKVADGLYNVVALVENKNTDAYSPITKYKFKLYDERNIPIAVRSGTTYINPNTRQAIFEGGVNVGKHEVGRVVFEFDKPLVWLYTDLGSYVLPINQSQPNFKVQDNKPMLNYTLQNTSYETLPVGNSVVIVYDTNNNAIAFSSTILDQMKADQKQTVVFSWPYNFQNKPVRFELYNQTNLAEYKKQNDKKN